jgi:hypothetical protein
LAAGKNLIFAAVLVLVGSGVAVAQNRTPQTKTFVSPSSPVISADSPPARNPAVNPSAAGLSQERMAAPSPSGSVGAGRQTANGGEFTEAQARRSLRYYGYTGIINLHVNGDGRWQAQATHNGRRVRVVLDEHGTATEQR